HVFCAATGHSTATSDAITRWYTTGVWNRDEVFDPLVDELTDKALAESDTEKRTAILKELYIHLATQCYDFASPAPSDFTAWQPWLKGYTGESVISNIGWGQTLARIWLDQDLRKAMVGR
ncbi:unnamed protein product, partial [marine sediment metagenome]